jgi:hypothetical protein
MNRRALGTCALMVAGVLFTGQAAAGFPFFGKKADRNVPLIDQVEGAGPPLGESADSNGDPEAMRSQRLAFGVVVDPELDRALNAVLQQLQRSWPVSPPPSHAYAIPTSDFNARSDAAGDIFVSLGMLRSIESEDELAALLGHEYAHVLLGHHDTNGLTRVSSLLHGVGSLYLATHYNWQGDVTTAMLREVAINELAMQSVQTGLMPSMTRDQEDEADRLGMDLMIRAGYNPVGMATFLGRMQDWEAKNAQAAEAMKVKAVELDQVFAADAKGMRLDLAPLVENGISRLYNGIASVVSRLRRQHADPEKRFASARDYLRGAHAEAARPEQRPLPWQESRQVAAVFQGIDQAQEAFALMGEDKVANASAALALAGKAQAGAARGTPFVRYVHALASPDREALAALARENQAPDSVFQAHLKYLELLEHKDIKLAVEALAASNRAFNDPPELLPYGIRYNTATGNTPKVLVFMARCTAEGNPQLQEACRQAAGGT